MSDQSASSSVEPEQLHRIVAKSDLEALRSVWQPDTSNNDDTLPNHELSTAVNAAVWELLLQMVHPVSDRTYADYTLTDTVSKDSSNLILEDKINNFRAPPDDTWEAWVDASALERVKQLRSQVRSKASSVQAKRHQVLSHVESLTRQSAEQSTAALSSNTSVPQLATTVQEEYLAKAQETQSAVDELVHDMQTLQMKIPSVMNRFQETLAAVQEETGRTAQAEQAVTISPDFDVIMGSSGSQDSSAENQAPPAEVRLLQFLAQQ